MEEKSKYNDVESQMLMDGINQAYKEMLLEKARLGQVVVTDNEEGEMTVQDARMVYERVYGPLPPLPAFL